MPVAIKPQANDFFHEFVPQMLVTKCSTDNKNLETDSGVQPEDQKSKAASHWPVPLSQTKKMGDPASTNPQIETKGEICLLP